MVDYFAERGMPSEPAKITREHVESFLAKFAVNHKPARNLEEGEPWASGQRRSSPPRLPRSRKRHRGIKVTPKKKPGGKKKR